MFLFTLVLFHLTREKYFVLGSVSLRCFCVLFDLVCFLALCVNVILLNPVCVWVLLLNSDHSSSLNHQNILDGRIFLTENTELITDHNKCRPLIERSGRIFKKWKIVSKELNI